MPYEVVAFSLNEDRDVVDNYGLLWRIPPYFEMQNAVLADWQEKNLGFLRFPVFAVPPEELDLFKEYRWKHQFWTKKGDSLIWQHGQLKMESRHDESMSI